MDPTGLDRCIPNSLREFDSAVRDISSIYPTSLCEVNLGYSVLIIHTQGNTPGGSGSSSAGYFINIFL
jgi:hypothetical protein